MADLDHDHGKGEGVRFLAVWPLVQNLRRGPSRAKSTLKFDTHRRIQAVSDRSEAKIRNACTACIVHKDIWLSGGQHVIR